MQFGKKEGENCLSTPCNSLSLYPAQLCQVGIAVRASHGLSLSCACVYMCTCKRTFYIQTHVHKRARTRTAQTSHLRLLPSPPRPPSPLEGAPGAPGALMSAKEVSVFLAFSASATAIENKQQKNASASVQEVASVPEPISMNSWMGMCKMSGTFN